MGLVLWHCATCREMFAFPEYRGVMIPAEKGRGSAAGHIMDRSLSEEEQRATIKRYRDYMDRALPVSVMVPCCPFCHEPLYTEKTEENRGD